MKILITDKKGKFKQLGWHIKENDTGFWVYFDNNRDVEFKFPWKLYQYTRLEKKRKNNE